MVIKTVYIIKKIDFKFIQNYILEQTFNVVRRIYCKQNMFQIPAS